VRAKKGRYQKSRTCSESTKRKIGKANLHHGHAQGDTPSPTYKTWRGMLSRCYNEKNASYPNYGGKGVTVCARWREAFDNFLEDIGPRPPGTTLDRFPNRNGNYEPGNCRWATRLEQGRNRDDVKLSLESANEILGRLEHGETTRAVAARFAISVALVSWVKTGRGWSELPPFQGKRPRARKLNADQVNEIIGRLEHGEHPTSIASRFPITVSMVQSIKTGRYWKEVPPFRGTICTCLQS
jgi:hypothetical protein